MAKAEIYALIDPRDMEIRYIGKANNSESRLKGHLREVRRRTPLYAWIGKLRSLGLAPRIEVICVATSDDWQALERLLIEQHRADGRLLNLADGGDEPHCSAEVRAANGRKVAAMRANDPRSAFIFNAKRTLGTALRQGHVSERTKVKMRLAAAKHPALFGAWAAI